MSLLACAGLFPEGDKPDDTAGDCAGPWYRDQDGDGSGDPDNRDGSCTAPDGYVAEGGDCDDQDPGAYSGAEEVCDNADNNCDGEIDEGFDLTTWYADADGDGFGVTTDTTVACASPRGYAEADGDCDDTNASIHPGADEADCNDPTDYNCDGSAGADDRDRDGYRACEDCDDADDEAHPGAVEVCDGADNDCDGGVDTDAVDPSTWYADNDGDGYGDDGERVSACDAPEGYVAQGGDCDDSDEAYNPGAVEEDCSDPNDYNCDGSAGTDDRDRDGSPACEDCDDTEDAAYPGAREVCDDIDNDCEGTVDEGAVDAPTWYVDDDGDAYGDSGTSRRGCDQPAGYVADDTDCDDGDDAVNPGEREVCKNGVDDDCDGSGGACELSGGSLSGADAQYAGEAAGDLAGWSVSRAGDVDGDGYDDLLLGSYYNSDGGDYAGAAHLVLGRASPTSLSLKSADAQYTGVTSADRAGGSVSGVGDVDADGYDDLLIGAAYHYDGGYKGSAFLILGERSPASRDLSAADAEYVGEREYDEAGADVSGAGDVDGDGYADLLVGAPHNDDGASYAGAAYLVLGQASPASGKLSAADAQYTGEDEWDYAGYAVSGGGDVDGDGYDDALIGAISDGDGGTDAGAAYLVLGGAAPASESLKGADAQYTGESASDYAGESVSGAGDLDADGYDDLLVGAAGNDGGGSGAGAAYVILGGASPASRDLSAADAKYTGEAATDYAGNAVSGAGDADGDGYGDFLVGAYQNDDGGSSAGAAYLILGSGL